MRRFYRRALALLGVGIATLAVCAVAAPAASAAPAHSAASCYGDGCYGLDPYYAGCTQDAGLVNDLNGPSGYLELMYSPSCDAAWANINDAYNGAWVQVENGNGNSQGYTVGPGDDGFGATYMVGANGVLTASDPDGTIS
jgi:hypothetical protein